LIGYSAVFMRAAADCRRPALCGTPTGLVHSRSPRSNADAKSGIRRPADAPRATFGTCEPAAVFNLAKQTAVAVAPIRMLTKPAGTIRRHCALSQRQARCFAQQIALAPKTLRGRIALNVRRERDRTVVTAD
jgi:hypothetical protein